METYFHIFVPCVHIPKSKARFQHLQPGRKYLLLEITADCYRVINDKNDPILYPKKWFTIVDENIEGWVKTEYEDGEYNISPEQLSDRFFYEDWFDGHTVNIEKLKKYISPAK